MHWQPIALDQLAAKQRLAPGAVHVWWWPEPLQQTAATRRQRTDVILRTLLARYMAVEPHALLFGREAKGRPYLQHSDAPDFNLSDTGGGSVLAVASGGRVGVDVERWDRAPPAARLTERWFASEEAEALRGLNAECQRRAFLRLWTAKEAACKATGTGIYGHLAAWRFAIDEVAASPVVVDFPPDAGAPGRWRFHRLSPAPAHTVALACLDILAYPQGYIVVR